MFRKTEQAAENLWPQNFLPNFQTSFCQNGNGKPPPIEAKRLKRAEFAKLIVDSTWKKVLEYIPRAPPKAKHGEAITDSANQWESLKISLAKGTAELSNKRIKNHLRHFAVGRSKLHISATTIGADASLKQTT